MKFCLDNCFFLLKVASAEPCNYLTFMTKQNYFHFYLQTPNICPGCWMQMVEQQFPKGPCV